MLVVPGDVALEAILLVGRLGDAVTLIGVDDQLGLDAKPAQLVFKIDSIMKERHLKQVDAAVLFGVRQPDISKMLRGEFRQFSVERLLHFLVALDQDVEIVVKPHRDTKNAPALHVS